jgi:NADH-quinone oxidoreductase subunit I
MWGLGLLNGLRISMRNMLRGPITVKYPHEKLVLPERARWAVRPKYFDDGSPRCTACMACVRVCPDHILSLDVTTGEDKTKHIDAFGYEIGACMMCGLCVEACPFDAIKMSHDYELAVTDVALLNENLIVNVDAATGARHKAEKQATAGEVESGE